MDGTLQNWDQYDSDQQNRLTALFDSFRTQINDFDSSLNILNNKQAEFTDAKIMRFFDRAIKDINGGAPPTHFTLFDFPEDSISMLVDGAVIYSLIATGILQLRNQYQAADSGLNMGMFQKTGQYQNWGGFILQTYLQDKVGFKRGVMARTAGAGFVGLSSEFGMRYNW